MHPVIRRALQGRGICFPLTPLTADSSRLNPVRNDNGFAEQKGLAKENINIPCSSRFELLRSPFAVLRPPIQSARP